MSKKLTRVLNLQLRQFDSDSNDVEGVAAVFDREADLGWFTERIDRHAFDHTDMSDVVLNFNHDNSLLLAGTRNGSLQLQVTDEGLLQKASIIDTTQGRDVMKLVRSGLISSMSFAFTIADGGEIWETRSDGREYRTITDIDRIYDVSLVVFPAYPQTSAWMRSGDELAEQHKALMEKRAEQDKRLKELLHE
jgi:HK97 family phage prohead protease